MRILYLCADHGIPVSGRLGSSTHVREFCRALQKAGHPITLLASNAGDAPASLGDLDVHIVDPPRSKKIGYDFRNILHNRRFYREALRLSREKACEVIYERNSLYATAGCKLAKKLGMPRMLEINAFFLTEHAKKIHFPFLARRAEIKIARSASAVAVVSEPLRQAALERGVRDENLFIMPTAVNIESFRPEADLRARSRKRWGLDGRFVVGYVGGLAHWHGIDSLYALAEKLRSDCPELVFFVVGGTPEEIARHRQAATERGLDGQMLFAGSFPHEEVPAALNAMDTAIIPDTMPWTCPTKLFEYMAVALPPVAPRYPAIESNLSDDAEGRLFEPSDMDAAGKALADLYKDRGACERMGRAARERVSREHSWECNVQRTMERFERLLQTPGA